MGWDEGHFHFEAGEPPERVGGEVEVRVRVDSLLMEGARRIDEWSRLESKIPDSGWVPVLVPSDQMGATPLDLRPGEWEVLAEIDGERDLRQLAADLGRSSFDLAKVIYGLIGMGVVHLVEQSLPLSDGDLEDAVAASVALYDAGDYAGVTQRLRELQIAEQGRADLILLEGRALVALGRYRAATEAFARAVELDPLSAEAHDLLGMAAARTGDYDRVAGAWDAFLRLSADPARTAEVEEGLTAARTLQRLLTRLAE
jgi:tetratricopeptide (TPR) repeat protein